jgi:hypothetical protein
VRRALGRSRELVRGRWWRHFGYALVWTLAIVGSIASVPVEVAVGVAAALSPSAAPALQALASIVNVLLQGLITPLTYCAWLLYYFDLRARQDGVVDPLPPETQPAV